MPTTGALSGGAAHRPEEPGIAEAEDAAVRGHQPVPGALGRGRHAHHRPVERGRRPVDPRNRASPKLKMPPSEATSQ